MSDLTTSTTAVRHTKLPSRRRKRPHIQLANGDFLEPRFEWAEGVGISDKTAGRMNLPTTYIGNVAYVLHNASTQILADRVSCRNEPLRRVRA